jgi:hypothetical protein
MVKVAIPCWRQATELAAAEDWSFASLLKLGRLPYSSTGFWRELQRAAMAPFQVRRDTPLLHPFPKIDPSTGKRWTFADAGKAALNEICDSLNSEIHRELKDRLREWVERWKASGPNLKKLLESLHDPHEGMALVFAMRTFWSPTNQARAELYLVPDYPTLVDVLGEPRVWIIGPNDKRVLTPEAEALTLFHLLTVLPGCEKVAGPCQRCGRYYIKKRASQKVYCSRKCGNAATAIARTSERIANERRDKLDRAKKALKEWKSGGDRTDWKHWVAQKTGIDSRFLTRAVNKGDLVQPKEER